MVGAEKAERAGEFRAGPRGFPTSGKDTERHRGAGKLSMGRAVGPLVAGQGAALATGGAGDVGVKEVQSQ